MKRRVRPGVCEESEQESEQVKTSELPLQEDVLRAGARVDSQEPFPRLVHPEVVMKCNKY